MKAIRCPECDKFLFEIGPEGVAGRIVIKCTRGTCGKMIEVKDGCAPTYLPFYQSANARTFYLHK